LLFAGTQKARPGPYAPYARMTLMPLMSKSSLKPLLRTRRREVREEIQIDSQLLPFTHRVSRTLFQPIEPIFLS
jgi:hypothetical protein